MATSKVSFSNQSDFELSARIELPDDQHAHSYALFAHCFTCNKNFSAVRNISKALTSLGFGVMRFDFTGLGESDGEFEDTNFSNNISDLVSAANFLSENYEPPCLIIGHSLGGAAAIFAGSQIDSIKAIATIGAPSNPVHVQHLFQSGIEDILEDGEAKVSIGGRPFTIKQQFLDDIAVHKLEETLRSMRKPLLVMHSPQDAIVGIENAAEIYKAAWHPKNFLSLDNADHLLSSSRDSVYAGQMIATWALKYTEVEQTTPLKSSAQSAARIGNAPGFTTEILAGGHELIADEPAEVGGNDFGPTPYELVSAGLAACTVMTMKMYAKRKDWPMEGATAHVSHNRRHLDDCKDCDDPKQKIDVFEKRIELSGPLDEAQRKRILDIASRCPVHKTLESQIKIDTTHG